MMSSSRVGDFLSARLSALRSYHEQQRNIWDIGCDHGLLGLSFQKQEGIESIHLVDPSAPVIDELRNKLKDSYITKGEVFIHHKQGQRLNIESDSNCIFIAGMGGKEIGEIIIHLLPNLDVTSRIVISPHRKILELRALLGELPLTLIQEELIFEDGQYYQILCLMKGEGPKVHPYGTDIWKNEVGEMYRNHQIKHFGVHEDLASKCYVEYLAEPKLLKST